MMTVVKAAMVRELMEVLNELKFAGGYEGRLLVTQAPAQLMAADHVLLYLDMATWPRDGDDSPTVSNQRRYVNCTYYPSHKIVT